MFEDSNISPMFTNLVDSLLILLASDYTIMDLNISAEQVFNTQKIAAIGQDISFLCPSFDKKICNLIQAISLGQWRIAPIFIRLLRK